MPLHQCSISGRLLIIHLQTDVISCEESQGDLAVGCKRNSWICLTVQLCYKGILEIWCYTDVVYLSAVSKDQYFFFPHYSKFRWDSALEAGGSNSSRGWVPHKCNKSQALPVFQFLGKAQQIIALCCLIYCFPPIFTPFSISLWVSIPQAY